VHLVGFTIEIYYDARPYERQICIGDAAFSCLTMAELICVELKCVLEILFLSSVDLPGTGKWYLFTEPQLL
jgi:hypothetical protein